MSFEHEQRSCNTIVNALLQSQDVGCDGVSVNRLGSTKRAGSRLPEANRRTTVAPFRDINTGYIDIREGSTNTKVHWRIKAQYFFDRTDYAIGIASQFRQRFRMTEQSKHAISDRVNGSLVSGTEQQHRGG